MCSFRSNCSRAIVVVAVGLFCSAKVWGQLPSFDYLGQPPVLIGQVCGLEARAYAGVDGFCPDTLPVSSGCANITRNQLIVSVSAMAEDPDIPLHSSEASASHEIDWTLSRGSNTLLFSGASILDHMSMATLSQFAGQREACASTNSIIGGPDRWRGNLHLEFDFSVDGLATLSNTFTQQDLKLAQADVLVVTWTIFDGANVIQTGILTSNGSTDEQSGSVVDFDLLGGVTYTFIADYTIDPTAPISTSAVGVPADIPEQTKTITDCAPDDIGCLATAVDDWFISFVIVGNGLDCNNNNIPDVEEIALGLSDCNNNNIPDLCEIGESDEIMRGGPNHPESVHVLDFNNNGVLDECEFTDCNGNGLLDFIEAYFEISPIKDCNKNYIPDVCDIDPTDPDGDGLVSSDCNENDIPDECDDFGCVFDIDSNGVINVTDLIALLAAWGPCPAPCNDCAETTCIADGFRNCNVDQIDLNGLLATWGPCSP